MSIFIPLLIFFGTELWKLIKINLPTTRLLYVLLYCLTFIIIVMLMSHGSLPIKVIFKNIFKSDEERVIVVLKEVIIYRDHVKTSLTDDKKDYNYKE